MAKLFMKISLAVLAFALIVFALSNMASLRAQRNLEQGVFYQDSVTAFTEKTQPTMLVPVGITAGVRFYTDGVVVLGVGEVTTADGNTVSPSENKLQAGDVIMAVGGTKISNITELATAISSHHTTSGTINLEVNRSGNIEKIEIKPAECCTSGLPKIGCWVRDSTQGIGTITYFNPETKVFSALGHGILDVDTKQLLTVREGELVETKIIQIKQGKKGCPGELIGEINENILIGTISKNTPLGLFGTINPAYPHLPKTTMPAATRCQIVRGPAHILSNIEGAGIKSYDIFIESINQDPEAEKTMVVRITDQGLLSRTNGIVQGMSGSPIIQNNHLIGSITHVFVQNPQRGYGLSIDKVMVMEDC